MEISWGFLIVIILILFPGLIFRRLYYYGEFSKQFGAGMSLIKLISISSIPGLINLVCIYYFYTIFISNIDIGAIVDTFKDISNPEHKWKETTGTTLNTSIENSVSFLSFLFLSSILLGMLLGRLVRITRIDTKVKLLRFKNQWFYMLSGEMTKFKKLRHLKEQNKKHIFTKADVLIDVNDKAQLYSGVVVDYELLENDCQTLSKIMLQNAERYVLKEGKKVPVKIPGNILVVDCSSMKNINLTYVYERTTNFLESKIPAFIDNLFSIIIVLLIPFFFFQTDFIEWNIYREYFDFPWYKKVFTYLFVVQILNVINPFVKNKEKDKYEFINWKLIVAKIAWILVLFLLMKYI
jgi:hypothetical protein